MSWGYGRIFSRLYQGSMYGKGAINFAVMGYVIANQTPSGREADSPMEVELNAAMLADTLGEEEKDVAEAISFLCSADKGSRSKGENGARLVKEGEFTYRVVNGRYYRDLIVAEEVREKARRRKERQRKSAIAEGGPPVGQAGHQWLAGKGATQDALDRHEAAVMDEVEANKQERLGRKAGEE